MNRLYSSVALLLVFSLFSACQKVDFEENGGITEKTAQNAPNGSEDSSHWSIDEDWNKQEQALFKNLQLPLNESISDKIRNPTFSFYPNPVATFGTFDFDFLLGSQQFVRSQIEYVIVDRRYNVVQGGTMRQFLIDGFALSFKDKAFKKGKTYRMYYVAYDLSFTDIKTFLCKGHGDIKIAD